MMSKDCGKWKLSKSFRRFWIIPMAILLVSRKRTLKHFVGTVSLNNVKYRVSILLSGKQHQPIIILEAILQKPRTFLQTILQTPQETKIFHHAVVLNDIKNYHSNGTIAVRNSLAGNMLFGQKQPSLHEIECKVTKNPNQWNLAMKTCYYIEFGWSRYN